MTKQKNTTDKSGIMVDINPNLFRMQCEMRTGLFLAPFFPRHFHKAQTNDHL